MRNRESEYVSFVIDSKNHAANDHRKSYHYDLKLFEDNFRFTLAMPPTGQIIEDDFEGLYKRKQLYQNLEDGEIYDWLVEFHESILDEQNQAADS